MIHVPISLFLDIFENGLCTSSDKEQGRAMLDIAGEEYAFAHRDMNRVIYTITVARSDFPNVKEKTVVTLNAVSYVVAKPPLVDDDSYILICVKA